MCPAGPGPAGEILKILWLILQTNSAGSDSSYSFTNDLLISLQGMKKELVRNPYMFKKKRCGLKFHG